MVRAKLADLEVRQRQSFYGLLARLLVKHAHSIARHTGAPLSPRLVANCASAVAGIFESSFPGYLKAGLARVVARKMTEGVV